MKNIEVASYDFLYEKIENKVLHNRIKVSLEYYIRKANLYKLLWSVFSIISIVLPSLATYLAGVNVGYCWLALITAITAVVSGIMALFKYADKKSSYRNSAESLKSELCTFSCASGPYKYVSNREELLSENVEKIIKEGYEKIVALDNNMQINKTNDGEKR